MIGEYLWYEYDESLSDLIDRRISDEIHSYEILQCFYSGVDILQQIQKFLLTPVFFCCLHDEIFEIEGLLIDLLHFFESGDDDLIILWTPFQESLLDFVVWRRAFLEVWLQVHEFVGQLLVESSQETEESVLIDLHRTIIIEKAKSNALNFEKTKNTKSLQLAAIKYYH